MNRFLDLKAPSSRTCLYNCLAEVRLEKFYDGFVREGIDSCGKLSLLSMLDFGDFGISSIVDRVRLFQLIQIIKTIVKKDASKRLENKENDGIVKKISHHELIKKEYIVISPKLEKCLSPTETNNFIKDKLPSQKNSDQIPSSRLTTPKSVASKENNSKNNADRQSTSFLNSPQNTHTNNITNKKNPPSLFKVKYIHRRSPNIADVESNVEDAKKQIEVRETIYNHGYNYGVIGTSIHTPGTPQGFILLLSKFFILYYSSSLNFPTF